MGRKSSEEVQMSTASCGKPEPVRKLADQRGLREERAVFSSQATGYRAVE